MKKVKDKMTEVERLRHELTHAYILLKDVRWRCLDIELSAQIAWFLHFSRPKVDKNRVKFKTPSTSKPKRVKA